MGYLDNLENDLKNMENAAANDPAQAAREHDRRKHDRAASLEAAPVAEELRKGKFTPALMSAVTRISHGLRTKVSMAWMGTTLRLEAREHRLELRPTPKGVMAYYFVNGTETGVDKVDLKGNAEKLAKKWLDVVGPRPPQAEITELGE